MIGGIVAQEKPFPPHGTLVPARVFANDDFIITPFIGSGLDRAVAPPKFIDAEEEIFAPDMPTILMSDAVINPWEDAETIYWPNVIQDQFMQPLLYTNPDSIFAPDVRIPGALLPKLVVSDDIIYPTPLQLPHGIMRAEVYYDPDLIPEHRIDQAFGIFPQTLVTDVDVIYPTLFKSGLLIAPLFLDTDVIYPFINSQGGYRPPFYIDTAEVPVRITHYDENPDGVTLSADQLTVTKANDFNYCGVSSQVHRYTGKYYFEVTLGDKNVGNNNSMGVMIIDTPYSSVATGGNSSVCMINVRGDVDNFNYQGNFIGGRIVSNGTNWPGFQIDYGKPGDTICVAVDLDAHLIWFRRNNDLWNSSSIGRWGGYVGAPPLPPTNPDADPAQSKGGASMPSGMYTPVIFMGAQSGFNAVGSTGDRMIGNFGASPFRFTPPVGFNNWAPDPIFPGPGPDRFGPAFIASPCMLNGTPTYITMSLDNLTATHSNTSGGLSGNVYSLSFQNYGKFYFEVLVGQTSGPFDGVGFIPIRPVDGVLDANLATWALGSGDIFNYAGGQGVNLGAWRPGDIICIAVDFVNQDNTHFGKFWARRKTVAGVLGAWNPNITVSDPEQNVGGIAMSGQSPWTTRWSPYVTFDVHGAVGDYYTLNFGQSAFQLKPPNAFGVFPRQTFLYIQSLSVPFFTDNDTFPATDCDLQNKTLFHPNVPAPADDVIFPARSTGGTLVVAPLTVVDAADVIFPCGYLGSLDGAITGVIEVTPNKLTVIERQSQVFGGVVGTAEQVAGKYYIEWRIDHMSGSGIQFGVTNVNAPYGVIYGTSTAGFNQFGGFADGDVCCMAIDLNAHKIWIRKNGGLWDVSTAADPVFNVGGTVMQFLSYVPYVTFSGGQNFYGDQITARFGQSAMGFPVPAGYSTGWPGSSSKQPIVPPVWQDNETIHLPAVSPFTFRPPFHDEADVIPLISGSGGTPTLGPRTVVIDNDTFLPVPSMKAAVAMLDGITSYYVNLSNDHLTAIHANTQANAGVYSLSGKTTGKWYFEVKMTTTNGAFDCCGLLAAGGSYVNLVSNGTNCVAIYKSSGNIFSNNGNSGKTLGAIAAGDVLGFAVDLTARKAWVRKNGGFWNGISTETPVGAGVGGAIIAATVALYPAIGFGGSGTAANDAQTINFGPTYQSAAPAGYGDWSLGTPVYVTLDPATVSATTLSNGNLTATYAGGGGSDGAKSVNQMLGGKLYFECTLSNMPVTINGSVGMMLQSQAYSSQILFHQNSGAVMFPDGSIWNGAATGKTIGAMNNGTVVACAFDMNPANRQIWFRKLQSGVTSNWNGDPTADPSTGVGGISYGAIGGNEYQYATLAWNGVTGNQVTMNFGASAFALAMPTGYEGLLLSR